MQDFLQQMARSSAARAAAVRRRFSAADFDRPSYPLRLDRFDLIAELKNRSPAEGDLADHAGTRADRASAYAAGGAAAISVLTEPQRFDGELAHLSEVVAAVASQSLPVMRKDFLVDVVQVEEAKACGASGVLLIAAMLDDAALKNLLDCAIEHKLFVLLESFDADDWQRSVALLRKSVYRDLADAGQLLFGVNTRNLRDLAVDADRLQAFSASLPGGATCVAESGQHTPDDIQAVAELGYRMALVGTALMRAANPALLIEQMLQRGRRACT